MKQSEKIRKLLRQQFISELRKQAGEGESSDVMLRVADLLEEGDFTAPVGKASGASPGKWDPQADSRTAARLAMETALASLKERQQEIDEDCAEAEDLRADIKSTQELLERLHLRENGKAARPAMGKRDTTPEPSRLFGSLHTDELRRFDTDIASFWRKK